MDTVAMLPMYGWDTIPWKKLRRSVWKLQKRIYQATLQGNGKLVRKLQRLLLSSRAAKLLAVRRVTQDNSGKKTAGVDGVQPAGTANDANVVLGGTTSVNETLAAAALPLFVTVIV